MTDRILLFIFNHPKKVIGIMLAVVFVLSIIFLFINNTVLIVSVKKSPGVSSEKISISTSGKEIFSFLSVALVPRQTKMVEVSSGQESTIKMYSEPLLLSRMDFNLDTQKHITKIVSPIFPNNDCVYDKSSSLVYSWQCGAIDTNIQTTKYSSDAYPEFDIVNNSLEPLLFSQMYKKGIIGYTNRDSTTINYTDLSADNPNSSTTKSIDLSNGIYPTNSTLLVDSKDGNSFVVVSNDTNNYYLYRDETDTNPTKYVLPDTKNNGVYSKSYQYSNGKLYIYYGISSLDVSHGSTSKDPMSVSVVNVSDNKLLKSTALKNDTYCDTVVFSEEVFSCSNSSFSRIINYDGSERFSLKSTGGVVNINGSIGIINSGSLYMYDLIDNSLRRIFSSDNQNISSVISSSGKVVIKTLFSRSYGNQSGIIYRLDLSKDADYNSLEYKLPLTSNDSGDVITSIDYNQKTIYAKTVVPIEGKYYDPSKVSNKTIKQTVEGNRQKIIDILNKKSIDTSSYNLVIEG